MVNLRKKILKKKILIVLVFLVAFAFRIYKITDYPVSLSMDEAAIGYNAYSIAKTGHDEWGEKLPLAFKSAFDYKPPVDIYLTVPFVSILGLTELSVRLPVVLIGSLSAVFLMLLVNSLGISLMASFFIGIWMAVSPWHIHFSRGSFEAVTALFFAILGTYSFFKWIDNKKYVPLLISIVSFCLSVWSYHAERVFVPLLFVFLVYSNRERMLPIIKKYTKKQYLILLGAFSLLSLPFLYLTLFTPAIRERAVSTSILRDVFLSNNLHKGEYANSYEFIFDNDYYLIFRHWMGKYLRYFDLRFWFWKGLSLTPPKYPGIGLMYLADLPIFILGLVSLIKSKKLKRLKKIVLFWFFAGPIPASLAMNDLHALRSLVWLPFFAFIIVCGFEYLIKNKKGILFGLGYLFFVILNLIYFKDIYFKQFPKYFSEYWQYGYKQVSEYACEQRLKYDYVVISETFGSNGPLNTGIPSYYVLFYCKENREEFVKSGKHLKEFLFHRPNYISDNKLMNALRIGSPWDFDGEEIKEEDIIKRFYFINGKEAFRAVADK